MCDIWKDNKNLKQLTEDDIAGLLSSLKKFETTQVLMSGGEALLNKNFFRFCEILKKERIKISLLSTGLTIKKNADQFRKSSQQHKDALKATRGEIERLSNKFRNLAERLVAAPSQRLR